jgi:hypothetical protein
MTRSIADLNVGRFLGFTILGVMAPAGVSSLPDERFRPSRNRRTGDLFCPAATTADQDAADR